MGACLFALNIVTCMHTSSSIHADMSALTVIVLIVLYSSAVLKVGTLAAFVL